MSKSSRKRARSRNRTVTRSKSEFPTRTRAMTSIENHERLGPHRLTRPAHTGLYWIWHVEPAQ